MVHISTKYPLTVEQTALLDEKKQHWWLKRLNGDTDNTFVKSFPRIKCSEPVDVDIEIADNKYCLGCGDWNVTDSQGYHCSKRTYLMVSGGTVKYFKNKAELDAAGADEKPSPSDITGYSAFGSTPTQSKVETPKVNAEEVSVSPDVAMFCVNDKKTVSRNYNCIVNFNKRCDEISEEDCYNCVHGRQLFYKNVKE